MGQPIVVIEKPSVANPGMVRFETNRAISGMGHERYVSGVEVRGNRPPDELARRLLAHGGVDAVHINGSVVTVDLEKGHDSGGLKEIVENLYIFYPETDEAEEAADEANPTEVEAAVESEAEVVEPEAAESEEAPVDAVGSEADEPEPDGPEAESETAAAAPESAAEEPEAIEEPAQDEAESEPVEVEAAAEPEPEVAEDGADTDAAVESGDSVES